MQDAITRDREVMHGTPVFRGTRVPVQTLFDYIEDGDSSNDFLERFPTVQRFERDDLEDQQIQCALDKISWLAHDSSLSY